MHLKQNINGNHSKNTVFVTNMYTPLGPSYLGELLAKEGLGKNTTFTWKPALVRHLSFSSWECKSHDATSNAHASKVTPPTGADLANQTSKRSPGVTAAPVIPGVMGFFLKVRLWWGGKTQWASYHIQVKRARRQNPATLIKIPTE